MLRRLLHPLQTRRCFLRLPRRRPHERRGHTTRMLHGTEPERRNRRPGPCRTCPFHTHRIGWLRASANCGRCYVPLNWLPWPLSLTEPRCSAMAVGIGPLMRLTAAMVEQ